MRKSSEILKELNENKELATAEGLMADEKDFIEEEIADLEKELASALEAEKSSPKKKEVTKKTTAKKAVVKTPKAAKTPKEKAFIIFEGKKIFEDDADYCGKLVQAWRERKEAQKKAAGKRKTKPVTQRVAANVASAVTKGIETISAKEIKDNPKKAIAKMERLEKAGKEFLEAFRDILGETITQAEIKEEFEGLDRTIQEISKKYLKKKTENDNEVDENKAHYLVDNDTIFVDSNFLNQSKGILPSSELKHMGGGEFYLLTPEGNIDFIRKSDETKGFVGRTHKLSGDKSLLDALISGMKKKGVLQEIKKTKEYAKGGEVEDESIRLARLGIIESNDENGYDDIQRIDNPEEYAEEMGLDFIPPKLINDNHAKLIKYLDDFNIHTQGNPYNNGKEFMVEIIGNDSYDTYEIYGESEEDIRQDIINYLPDELALEVTEIMDNGGSTYAEGGKLYTAEELKKKYKGKYINTYPHHYEKRDKDGNWITVYEVRGTSNKIKENFNLPEDEIIYAKGGSTNQGGGQINLRGNKSIGTEVEVINEWDENGNYGEVGTITAYLTEGLTPSYVVKFYDDDAEYTYIQDELGKPTFANGGSTNQGGKITSRNLLNNALKEIGISPEGMAVNNGYYAEGIDNIDIKLAEGKMEQAKQEASAVASQIESNVNYYEKGGKMKDANYYHIKHMIQNNERELERASSLGSEMVDQIQQEIIRLKDELKKYENSGSTYADGGEVIDDAPIEVVSDNILIAINNETYLTTSVVNGNMYKVISVVSKKPKYLKKGTKVMVFASVFQPDGKKGSKRFKTVLL